MRWKIKILLGSIVEPRQGLLVVVQRRKKDINDEWENINHLVFLMNTSGHRLQSKGRPIFCVYIFCEYYKLIQWSQQIARNKNPLNLYIHVEGCKNNITFKKGIINDNQKYFKEVNTTPWHSNIYFNRVDTKATFGVKCFENPLQNYLSS